MIRDNPQGADLLSEARRVLSEDVLPTLAPEVRYQALMAIRAVSLVENQLRADPEVETELDNQLALIAGVAGPDSVQCLATQIRAGIKDASQEVFDLLEQVVTFKLNETGLGNQ